MADEPLIAVFVDFENLTLGVRDNDSKRWDLILVQSMACGGPKAQSALRCYQETYALTVTGEVDLPTLMALDLDLVHSVNFIFSLAH